METWEVQVTVVPAQYRPSARVKIGKRSGSACTCASTRGPRTAKAPLCWLLNAKESENENEQSENES